MPKGKGHNTGNATGRNYQVPVWFTRAVNRVAGSNPVLHQLLEKIAGSESNFSRNAKSPTGALGLGQFTRAALLEDLYRNRNSLDVTTRKIIEKNIEPVNIARKDDPPVYRYRLKKDGNMAAVQALLNDETVAVTLTLAHIKDSVKMGEKLFRKGVKAKIDWIESTYPRKGFPHERVNRLKEELKRPLNFADVKTLYMCGPKGGSDLMMAYADMKTHGHRSGDYTTKTVAAANPHVFTTETGANRSVAEYYQYMKERVGDTLIGNALHTASQSAAARKEFHENRDAVSAPAARIDIASGTTPSLSAPKK